MGWCASTTWLVGGKFGEESSLTRDPGWWTYCMGQREQQIPIPWGWSEHDMGH